MTSFEVWIAECHLAHVAREGGYQCLAAVWADSHDSAMQQLAEHLDPQGYRILWVDVCTPAHAYSGEGAEIVTGAHAGQPVVLGPVTARHGQGAAQSYLSVQEIEDVEPLGNQFGVWPLKTVPDALREPLFGEPEPTEAEISQYAGKSKVPPMATYAILDAAKVMGLVELLEASELEYRCLFKADAAEEYRDVAPYLVRLEPENSFARRLFTYLPDQSEHMLAVHMWHKEPGIYIRSRAGFDDIWSHFRKFTRIQDENGKWLYFRYWQPETCRHYLSGVKQRQERISYIMQTMRSEGITIVLYDSFQSAFVISPTSIGKRPSGPMIFDQMDLAILDALAFKSFSAELGRWLSGAYQDQLQHHDKKQLRALSDHVVAQGQQYGLTNKEDYVYLAHIMTTFGGWFHLTGQPRELLAIFQDDKPQKRERLKQAFLPSYQTTPLARITKNWAAVLEFVRAIPADERVTPKQFKRFMGQFLSEHQPEIVSLLRLPSEFRDDKGLPEAQKGKYIILELCLGYRFESDPFRHWSHLPPDEAVDVAWASVF